MGLGTVIEIDHRCVQIAFLAAGETRTYARQTAPLTRVRFSEGDVIKSQDDWSLTVEQIKEQDGLLTYIGKRDDGSAAELHEVKLNHLIQLSRAIDRLLTGQIDKPKWFALRQKTRQKLSELASDPLYGLTGTRTSLIPHQLYIAHEVSQRYSPRVLLADEVGLGKTIEAGLIIHQQLLTQRAQRILIVVPDTLIHQWLVEMLRKFNLLFSIFDAERCDAIVESIEQGDAPINPFETEQLVLCSLSFLTAHQDYFDQALSADWDCLVVDEAHHLLWSPDETSTEYDCIEQLARTIPSVLLLTATPEQLGKTGHYARLRLLDPDRFPGYEAFLEEEQHYAPIAEAVESLLEDDTPNEESITVLNTTLGEGDNKQYLDALAYNDASEEEKEHARERLIVHLLDRHGTGRVLFRNTRHAIKGFPQRQLHSYPLDLPEPYQAKLDFFKEAATKEAQLLLCPELVYEAIKAEDEPTWLAIDPRLPWLRGKLLELQPDKVLLITASAQSALDIAQYLHSQSGIHAAVFHEGLSIVERDRAAAFFADSEDGTQVLVCSEIGSEGRNFQFAHHLILFDLPLHPDLLEQRIGRLDRIGQQHTIQIHAPYLQQSAQATMLRWYHEGLMAFEHTCPAGPLVFDAVKTLLIDNLHQHDIAESAVDTLVENSHKLYQQHNASLQQGRDRLLEYSSCRPQQAQQLIEHVVSQHDEKQLNQYLDQIYDNLGIDSEIHSHTSLVIMPGEHVRASLPGLTEDGLTVTTHRQTALSNEDIQFLSWEHPLVVAAMDTVISSEMGNTAMVTIKHKGFEQGSLLVECLYTLESYSSKNVSLARYLPSSTIRVVIDHKGNQYNEQLTDEIINQSQSRIHAEIRTKVIQMQAATLRKMMNSCEKLANKQAPALIEAAKQAATEIFTQELDRLVALKTVNANIRDDELDHLRQEQKNILQRLDDTLPQLDAVRVMIVL